MFGSKRKKEHREFYNAVMKAAGKDKKGVKVLQIVVDKRKPEEKRIRKLPYKNRLSSSP